MAEEQPPLILCMENMAGEEVALRIEPQDNFQTFIDKAKESKISILDGDINSITQNRPVSLTDNIYQYLVNSDHGLNTAMGLASQTLEQILEPADAPNDFVYILDDGTQINASQIHFDNEDPQVDLTVEKIPFVQYAADFEEVQENVAEENTRKYNIIDSPVSSKTSSPKRSFINSVPFKLVCNNTSGFEAQFTKYLEGKTAKTYATLNTVTERNKSPRSLIREKYKTYDTYPSNINSDNVRVFSREDVLNMVKDSPVAVNPYNAVVEKRRHVRKTDPARQVFKRHDKRPIPYCSIEGALINQSESTNCFICTKYVENNADKMYLFDVEDQKLHRASPLKRQSRELKIICEDCLDYNFRPCMIKSPNQSLNRDEYLVIRNNQQYIFQQTRPLNFPKNVKSSVADSSGAKAIGGKLETERLKVAQDKDFVKVEIGSDGNAIEKSVDEPKDDVCVKDEKGGSSDVEIVENVEPEIDDSVIDNLEEADENVKEFLGKYQDNSASGELKCRFCEKQFSDVVDVIGHGVEHKHEMEEGEVYPCPLCDYGYANFKWLQCHLKAAHEKADGKEKVEITEDQKEDQKKPKSGSTSPIATRTRSSDTKKGGDAMAIDTDTCVKLQDSMPMPKSGENIGENISETGPMIIKTEVKQETLDTSDEEAIWIVQTEGDDSDANERMVRDMLKKATVVNNNNDQKGVLKNHCTSCSQIFPSAAKLAQHQCGRRRGRKRKCIPDRDTIICIPSEDDVVKRCRKKRGLEPSSDPQTVTCNDCNESFTSKVRLKFHMQFHDTNNMTTTDGQYKCPECARAASVPRSVFATESELFDHVHFQHDKLKRWQCGVEGCGKTFYLRANLTKHSRIHTDTRKYVCPTCGKRFLDKQTLDEHSVTHLQIKPYQCHICMKQLTRRSRLRMHLRAHEETQAPRHVRVCALCHRAFKDCEEAEEHARVSTSCVERFAESVKLEQDELQLSPGSGLVRRPDRSLAEPRQFSPAAAIPHQVEDSLALQMLAGLADEARSITRVVEIEKALRCEYCEDVYYTADGLNQHRVVHKGVKNPFTCHICKVGFATYSRCTTHKTTHGFYKRPLPEAKASAGDDTAQNPPSSTGILGYGGFPTVKHFLCEDCGRSYLHWTYLQVHRRMKHANDNFVYTCKLCNVSFPNSWSIAYHKKKNHADVQDECITTKVARENYKIPCRDCDEVLPNKTALYKHRKNKHSDCDKPGALSSSISTKLFPHLSASNVRCDRCGRTFTSAAARDKHLKEFHKNPLEHRCAQCSLIFADRSSLGAHLRSHAYPCAACGLGFRTSALRDEHLRLHADDDVCGQSFRSRSARPWCCARCGGRFRVRCELRAHLRDAHPDTIAVIEVSGLDPSSDEILSLLNANNIDPKKVLDITKMSFAKGSSSIIPCTERALALLSGSANNNLNWNGSLQDGATDTDKVTLAELFHPTGRGGAAPRRPAILQRGESGPQAAGIEPQELSAIDVQMLLSDNVIAGENRTPAPPLDESMIN